MAKKLKKPTAVAKKKTSRKKAAKKVAKKKASRKKPTAITPEKRPYFVKNHELRLLAARDYIIDSEKTSVEALYEREDRPYSKLVSLHTFKAWAYDDGWTPRRDEFWEAHEQRVYESMKDQLLRARLKEIESRTEERDAMSEYLRPLRDPDTGAIRRHPQTYLHRIKEEDGSVRTEERDHPLAGLPVLPLEMPRFDQFVTAFVKFDQHLMVMRGDATSRTESITRTADGPSYQEDLLTSAAGVQVDDDDIDAMARELLLRRQPELVNAIDASWEEVEESDPSDMHGLLEGSEDDSEDR